MADRIAIAIVFGLVALVTAGLPSGVMAGVANDTSLLVLPVLTAVFAAAWSALLSGRDKGFGYIKGFSVAVLSFVCVAITFAYTRSLPYGQALVGFLVVAWGFLVFPGFLGAAIAVWLLKTFAHEPNSALDRTANRHPSAALRSADAADQRGR